MLDYEELEARAAAATEQFHALSAQIKAAETRMAEIAVLKTHIANYAKTRDVYAAYRKAGYSKNILRSMRATSCCTRRRRKPLTSWASKGSPPSRACRRNTPSCYRIKRRRMPNTGIRAMRCASCCSTSRTWIVCWAKTSARRRRKRSMTGNNGHAPKRSQNAQPRILRVQRGLRGVAHDKQRGVFAAAETARKAKWVPLCPACHVFSRPSQRCFLCSPA